MRPLHRMLEEGAAEPQTWGVVPGARGHTTTLLSSDGTFAAEIISVPRVFPEDRFADPLGYLADILGVVRGPEVQEPWLRDMLQQLTYETTAARTASPNPITAVINAVVEQPVIIIEHSAPSGSSLMGPMTQVDPG